MTLLNPPELFTPATAERWDQTLLNNAVVVKLPATAWQDGGVTKATFATMANVLMLEDVATSLLNQGGFLDFAATGSVTYTDPVTGLEVTVPVTPDPSNTEENPTQALGALDVLADSVYNVQRILSTFAGGLIAILNTSATTYGPYAAGSYHVAQPAAVGSPTYSNTTTLTIAPSVVVGSVSNVVSSGGLIRITTGGAHGLTTDDIVAIAGVGGVTPLASPTAWRVTVVNATNFTLQGSALAGVYTAGGTVYTPTTASFQADAAGSASNATVANVVTTAVTTLVGVNVANLDPFLGTDLETNVALAARCRLKLQSISPNGPRGAYEFFALSSQQLAPTLTPPQEVSSAITRALVQVDPTTGVVVTTIANNVGAPTADDVTATTAVIQAYCVPDSVTSFVQAASTVSVAVGVTAWIPSAYASSVDALVQTAVSAYFQALQIAGITDSGAPTPNTNVVSYRAIAGTVFRALVASKVPVQDVLVKLNGTEANVQLALTPVPQVAMLSATTVTVTVVS